MDRDRIGRLRRLVGLELFKLRRRPMPWIQSVILAILAVLMPPLFYLAFRLSPAQTGRGPSADRQTFLGHLGFPAALQSTTTTLLSFGLPLIMILTAAAFGGEFAWGTLRLVASRGEGRREYVFSKIIALSIVWAGWVVFGVTLGIASATVVSVAAGQPGPWTVGGHDALAFLARLAGAWLGGLMYTGLTALTTVRTRSTAIGLAAGLVSFFGDRTLSGAATTVGYRPLELLARSGINYNVRSLTGGVEHSPNPIPIAALAIAVYLLATLRGTMRQIERQDIFIAGID